MRRDLTLAACLLLTACSSARHAPAASQQLAPSPTGTAATPGPSTPPASAAPRTTAQPGRALPTGSTGPAPAAAAPPPAGHAPVATAPGSYTYTSSGSYTLGTATRDASGTSTLTVGAVTGGTQHSTLHTDQGDTGQDVVLRPSGRFLSDLTVGTPFNKEFRPTPAVLLLPEPATVGTSWSWSARSTDGTSTVSTSNKLVRTEVLTIGGRRVSTVVLQTHLVLSGDVTYTADVTTWVASAYALPVKDHTVGHGTYGAFGPFSTDLTDVMRSVEPA